MNEAERRTGILIYTAATAALGPVQTKAVAGLLARGRSREYIIRGLQRRGTLQRWSPGAT